MSNKPQKPIKRLKKKLEALSNTPLSKEVTEKQAKSTKAEYNQRVTEIANLLAVGYTRSYILRYGSKWKLSDKQIDNYISEAWKYLKEINDLTLQDNLSMITNQLWDVYRDSRTNNDRASAIKALTQLSKIKGLEINNVNHIIEDKRELADLSNEELDKLLMESTDAKH